MDALGYRSSTHIPDTGALTWQRYGSGHVHGVLLGSDVLANFERDELHREVQRVQGNVNGMEQARQMYGGGEDMNDEL